MTFAERQFDVRQRGLRARRAEAELEACRVGDGVVESSDLVVPLPVFQNCMVDGTAFPDMLWRGGKNAMGKPLSGRQLFSGPKTRTITVGRRDVYLDAERWHETTLRYTVTLTRISKVTAF